MHLDVVDIRNFYGEHLGRVTRAILVNRLRAMWPSLAGQRLMGLGYTTPYARMFLGEVERLVALMPAGQGVVNWPSEGPNVTALVDDRDLPLPDASVDRALLVHALENADDPRALLREVWRVLAPGGRLIAVVPNRAGMWARVETSPFGFGRPYSRGQLNALLRDALFSPIDWRGALYLAPSQRRFLLRMAPAVERMGRTFWPAFGGVILVEATKQLYQGLPARARRRSAPVFRPVLAPQT